MRGFSRCWRVGGGVGLARPVPASIRLRQRDAAWRACHACYHTHRVTLVFARASFSR